MRADNLMMTTRGDSDLNHTGQDEMICKVAISCLFSALHAMQGTLFPSRHPGGPLSRHTPLTIETAISLAVVELLDDKRLRR